MAAIITLYVVYAFGLTLSGASSALLAYALICLAYIDYDTELLPDSITLPFIWLGLITNYFGAITSFEDAFWGACFGYGILWSVYQVFKLLTKKEGMGYGDFKMLAMLGAWLGITSIPGIIMISSISCLIIFGILSLKGRDLSEPVRFGPFLAIAGLIFIFWGDAINNLYLKSVIL